MVILNAAKMITTKKGDFGKSCFLGKEVDKDGPLLEAIGNLDELQAVLEIVRADGKIIDDLVDIMAFLVCDKKNDFAKKVDFLEKKIEEKEKNRIKFNGFAKFEGEKSLNFNWARTVCRRAERRVVALNRIQKIDKNILKYMNRLSDYLFLEAIKQQIKK